MAWFSEAYLDFFMELAPNNQKAWFDANRHIYQEKVRKPFLAFTQALIEELGKRDARLVQPAASCLFRINRDIRFSKNKDPYKLHMAAAISVNGKKDAAGRLGLYFQFSPEAIIFAGGAYAPDKMELKRIRDHIADHPAKFEKAISDGSFRKRYGGIQGDKNKRLTESEHKAAAEMQPLMYNKQFYYMAQYEDAMPLLKDNLLEWTLAHYDDALPVANYFEQALTQL